MSILVFPEPNVVTDLTKVSSEWSKWINRASMKLMILPIQEEESSRAEWENHRN